jgi:hypothetical protein
MKTKINFILELPINSIKVKKAFFGMFILLVISIFGLIVANIFYDEYTHVVYSIKLRSNIRVGWPSALRSWSFIFTIGSILSLPFVYFMQDWKNPSLAICNQGLFINQQLIRNTIIEFSNIEKIEKKNNDYKIFFKNNLNIISKQFFLFKPFVKYNLENNNFFISDKYSAGNIDLFFVELNKYLGK